MLYVMKMFLNAARSRTFHICEVTLKNHSDASLQVSWIFPTFYHGCVVAGKFIKACVIVSVPTYSLLRDPEAFEQPETFDPNRWISGDKEKMSKAHLPFSTGPRACIGWIIAYFEQLVLIATLVNNFEFELPGGDFELKTIEKFNRDPDELTVGCRRRVRM